MGRLARRHARSFAASVQLGGLRLVVLCSFPIGYLVLRSVQLLERACPGLRIHRRRGYRRSHQRRRPDRDQEANWRYLPQPRHIELETALVEAGLRFGVRLFTGDTKSEWFHERLREWNPDAVLVCGFGQLIDPVFLATPRLGVNNVHPSNLAAGIGIGPSRTRPVFLSRGDPTTA